MDLASELETDQPSRRAHVLRNFLTLATDYGLFGLGMSFYSSSTILPAFADRLGASNTVIGAIPSLTTVGYMLPALFFANYTERLPHKLSFCLRYTVWERVPLLVLAGVTYAFALRSPGVVLVLMLLLLALMSGIGGALMPAWMDLIGKVIPTDLRGRLLASAGIVASLLGLGGAYLSGNVLRVVAFPSNYAICFALGFVCLVGSYVSLALTVEPRSAARKPHVDHQSYYRRLPEVLARDRDLAFYLVSRALGVIGTVGFGFFTVFAMRAFQVPDWQVAGFTLVLLAGQGVASFLCGHFADQAGHKPILVAGLAATVLANLLALFASRVEFVYGAFLFMAVGLAASQVSAMTIVLELAPTPDRPTYIGLASTLIAPVALVAPLLGGIAADRIGYQVVFAASVAAAAASLVVLAKAVRDPRTRAGGLSPIDPPQTTKT